MKSGDTKPHFLIQCLGVISVAAILASLPLLLLDSVLETVVGFRLAFLITSSVGLICYLVVVYYRMFNMNNPGGKKTSLRDVSRTFFLISFLAAFAVADLLTILTIWDIWNTALIIFSFTTIVIWFPAFIVVFLRNNEKR